MNEDYKNYMNAINKLKVDLNIVKENNNILPLNIKGKNNQIIEQIEEKIESLVRNNNGEEETYFKDVINKVINVMDNIKHILDILYLKKDNSIDNNTINNIDNIIVSEIEKIDSFIKYTNEIININFTCLDSNNSIIKYNKYISDSILETKETIDKILYLEDAIYYNDIYEIDKSIKLLKEILNRKIDYLDILYNNISYIVCKNNNFSTVYDEYIKYAKRMIKILKDYDDVNSGMIINKIKYKVLPNIFNRKEKVDYSVYNIEKIENDEEKHVKDTKKYKNDYSLLNRSFWEARERTFNEKIKYPSVLFEKKIKQYQNDYLISNYNRSLDDIESSIEEYKKKYEKEIYMDEIYEEAFNQLKEESLLSVDEMCDESKELSELDRRAYIILNDRLMDIIRQIGYVKCDENLDDFIDITEYKRNVKLNELLDKKEMIEYNMYLIIKKRDKIENNV